ncbi:HNH endonuclease signature motif containing protein [Tessaracoccus lubricantis]|uniref:HNH endonuclease signature motif containing protein n=1 Tax=Tessaracoccus lubricantis TaxID=545543 RepID=A0ABP9F1I5_9ACTN
MVSAAVFQAQIEAAAVLAGQLAQFHVSVIDHAVGLLTDENWAGDGIRSPEHWLQVYFCLSPAQATGVVKIAQRRTAMEPVLSMMGEGRLSLDQAMVIAVHTPDTYVASVARMAEFTTVVQLRRTLSKYVFDDHDVKRPIQPEKPTPRPVEFRTYSTVYNGRYSLRLETDLADGELIETAIREAKDALFKAGDTDATLYDGFLEVFNRSLTGVESTSRQSKYRVLLHLDTSGNGWLNKKGAVPEHLLRRLTCDGAVVPVWETEGEPVNVGRTQRIVPLRTRRLIEDRDKGCRYPGCPVTRFVEAHHVIHWIDGGRTDAKELVSLCPRHHDLHHRGLYSITLGRSPGQFNFFGRGGLPIAPPPRGNPPPRPEYPPGKWQLAHRGQSIDPVSVYFTPQRE